MIRRPPRSTRTYTLCPTRRSSDLEQPSKRLAQIADGIAAVLADVRAAVEDWSDMRERCRAVIAELETRPPMLPVAEIAERSEEQTSELQSLMRISYAVFCLKKNNRE